MKHTQGKWHTVLNERGKYTRVYATPNKFICDARGRQVSLFGSESENEANAKLIAAAPDLLAVAYKCLEWCNGVQSPDYVNQLRTQTEAAINKATE